MYPTATFTLTALVAAAALLSPVTAQSSTSSCSALKPNYSAPSIASGYVAVPIATGLFKPRGIIFDTEGRILVVQQGRGIVGLTLNDGGGTCLSVKENKAVVQDKKLTHGIALSSDGKTLYASTAEKVFAWDYDPATGAVGTNKTLIEGMSASGHITRTLLLSQKMPGILLVSHGSDSNIDNDVVDIKVSRSQIKAFDLNTIGDKIYDYTNDGTLIGWGLRNSVGIAEDPTTGGLYSVENSADDLWRLGKDIHANNPGEKLNFHGYLNGTKTAEQGGNFGYPNCYAAWDVNDLPEHGNLTVGEQFAVNVTGTINDEYCQKKNVAPRLTFQAHMAPLDIKFSADGKNAYITFHGSWNRDTPIGYKLSVVAFKSGFPVAGPDSRTAVTDILKITDSSACPMGTFHGLPDQYSCFRPVGLAWDKTDRLFMTLDATGEVWVVLNKEAAAKKAAAGRTSGGFLGVVVAGVVGLLLFAW